MTKKLYLIIALNIAFSFSVFAGPASCVNGLARMEQTADIVFSRSFARVEAAQTAITITETDLKNAYGFGKLEITNVYIAGAPKNVNVGTRDLTNAQTWSIAGQTFTKIDTALVVNPNTTPQKSAFPNSTIALKEYRNYANCATCDDYEYYSFRNSGIYLDGETYLEKGTTTAKYEIDTLTFLLTDLPTNIQTNFIVKDTLDLEDSTSYTSGYIRSEAFGTITASDGKTHEVIQTTNLIRIDNGVRTTTSKFINYFSNTGYSLTLFLSDTSVTNGIAKVYRMEEKYITANVTNIEKVEIEKNNFKIYPNPAQNTLFVENAENKFVKIEDLMGNILLEKQLDESSNPIDISNLNAGIYFVCVDNRRIKFVKE